MINILDHIHVLLIVVTIIGIGINAGIYFAFSTFIMNALSQTSPEKAITTMKLINIHILNVWFGIVFGGSSFLCILLGIITIFTWNGSVSIIILIGSFLFLIGTIAVTMFYNVPLNEKLDKSEASASDANKIWDYYLQHWTKWNHVRTVSSICSMVCFLLVLI
ncbi:anthrone oxygenase family protein [Gracilibacillus sp. HCP3S3_G5_1]|uniref:anthrone oxygenase family protein n=1 Tax=unclassified Gracilibacillus TaxID=2625209 RepID=UPI003F8A073E